MMMKPNGRSLDAVYTSEKCQPANWWAVEAPEWRVSQSKKKTLTKWNEIII